MKICILSVKFDTKYKQKFNTKLPLRFLLKDYSACDGPLFVTYIPWPRPLSGSVRFPNGCQILPQNQKVMVDSHSPGRRFYPPTCKPCGLEAEPEGQGGPFFSASRRLGQNSLHGIFFTGRVDINE